jgi:aminoglycoside phosphotransferase (APT) family kinase protein
MGEDELHRLSVFLREAMGARDVAITHCHRVHGGASRETYSIDAQIDGNARGLILRRDPEASLIETDRALEFAAYQSAAGAAPVPQAIALVTESSILGAPFFVMSRIDGASAASPFAADPYGAHKAEIGAQFFSILGRIHAIDAGASPLARQVETPAPDRCWARELSHWERVIDADEFAPQPIARATIRRLRRKPPPPPPRLLIVHGDYRSGNFLHDGAGKIVAVLDWEMAHIGDPLEDLAWALDPLWSPPGSPTGAGMITREEAIGLWEQSSGLTFDPVAFQWWEMFASLKGLAIWISSARTFHDGKNTDPVLAFSGWYCTTRHEQVLAERLAAGALT